MYSPENLQVPDALMEKFKSEAKESVSKMMEKGFDINTSPKEYLESAYVEALKNVFIKNNGVPSIPFPISLSTVDMVCINRVKVMLGRKPGQDKWQFPGGFRDPGELSRTAAARELNEEANLTIDANRLEFIGELVVNDIRYRNTPHRITTQIFLCELIEEEMLLASPGDDLGEIKWYDIEDLIKDNSCIRDIHLPIFDILVSKLVIDNILKEISFC